MNNLETRLSRLEVAQYAPRRQYTDMERAVRLVYLLETGGPTADRLLAMLAEADEKHGVSHEQP